MNPAGSALVYSTYLGAVNISGITVTGIAVDSSGNAYVTGVTSSSNFPTSAGAFQTSLAGGWDAFVTKLNPTGSALVYSTYLGGSSSDASNGIGMDSSGNAYVAGWSVSSNFPTTAGAFQTSLAGSQKRLRHQVESRRLGASLLHLSWCERRPMGQWHCRGLLGRCLRDRLYRFQRLPERPRGRFRPRALVVPSSPNSTLARIIHVS